MEEQTNGKLSIPLLLTPLSTLSILMSKLHLPLFANLNTLLPVAIRTAEEAELSDTALDPVHLKKSDMSDLEEPSSPWQRRLTWP